MRRQILNTTLGIIFLFTACTKVDMKKESGLNPDCRIEHLELVADTTLINENGRIVETVGLSGVHRVRIQFKGVDTYLDPCNLPEGIDIGQDIRFSGTVYNIKNTDHLNLDMFPIGLSKIEIVNNDSEK